MSAPESAQGLSDAESRSGGQHGNSLKGRRASPWSRAPHTLWIWDQGDYFIPAITDSVLSRWVGVCVCLCVCVRVHAKVNRNGFERFVVSGCVSFRSVLVCCLKVYHRKPEIGKGMETGKGRKVREQRWGLEQSIC